MQNQLNQNQISPPQNQTHIIIFQLQIATNVANRPFLDKYTILFVF